jgi:proton glutamate symport protein
VGYSFNLNGSAVFLGLQTMFLAQLYDIHLSVSHQGGVVTMVLTSTGVAGVPGFMFVILSVTTRLTRTR